MVDKNEPKNEEPKEGPKKHEWWIALLLGIGILAGSVFIYFDLTKFEEEGGERRMHWLAVLLYEWLGKWGLVGVIVLMGVAMTIYGIVQLGNRLARKEEIEDEDEPRLRRRPIEQEEEEPRQRKRTPPVEDLDEERRRPGRRSRENE